MVLSFTFSSPCFCSPIFVEQAFTYQLDLVLRLNRICNLKGLSTLGLPAGFFVSCDVFVDAFPKAFQQQKITIFMGKNHQKPLVFMEQTGSHRGSLRFFHRFLQKPAGATTATFHGCGQAASPLGLAAPEGRGFLEIVFVSFFFWGGVR